MADIVQSLLRLRTDVAGCDLSELDTRSITLLIDELRRTDRSLTALKVRAGQRCDVLATSGEAPDAAEAFLGAGQVSGPTAR